jgi:hypothetical protein
LNKNKGPLVTENQSNTIKIITKLPIDLLKSGYGIEDSFSTIAMKEIRQKRKQKKCIENFIKFEKIIEVLE